MNRFLIALIALATPIAAFAEPQVIERGKQPVVQEFLTKHGILAAPNSTSTNSIVIHAKDYNDVSPFPAHDRKWSFERGGYVLKTSGKRNN